MKTKGTLSSHAISNAKLTSERGEKISAVEGMVLTQRMKALLQQTQDMPGDERRARIRAQFSRKSS